MTDLDTAIAAATQRIVRSVPDIGPLRQALERATSIEEVFAVENQLGAAEAFMRETGIFDQEEVRPWNETRMRARWKLGGLLAQIDRLPVGRPGKKLVRSAPFWQQFCHGK
jgi:hypothetical protein